MFESDDFDQILSQFDFNEVQSDGSVIKTESVKNILCGVQAHIPSHSPKKVAKSCLEKHKNKIDFVSNKNILEIDKVSPKHLKRNIINSHFDYNTKRKFPGPAGLLLGSLQENKDESVSNIELLSQDIDFSQHNIKKQAFESPLWHRLEEHVKKWKLVDVDSIISIKQQAVTGDLRQRKAQTVTAFVECVDRSVIDPLIVLRDTTGNIKCTLHRDAWSTFSSYIVSEYCALVLWKPTVLTTGSAFKKHYLNITLNNIFAIFSSAILPNNDEKALPNGFIKVYEELFTIIKIDKAPQCLANLNSNSSAATDDDIFDGLDNVFFEEIF
ncbi:homologous recombination OB-fold protein-like isoform X2 [Achroia grisella]|uniref:homologous recombination OB-fold protein-like isoform X2 n=1 Tax=Achroia grisella TaxID=688607 RepID=UPI0027D1F1A4|nr:homologous recombination OB-fold protein-like isoform X2 [Achroia grisella]